MANDDVYRVWGWMEDFLEQHPVDPPQYIREAAKRLLVDPKLAQLATFLCQELQEPYQEVRAREEEEDYDDV